MKPIYIKLTFKQPLLKLTTESTFIFNIKCHKQTDGCSKGGPLLVVFSGIYMSKLEKDTILPPREPTLYKRFVDNIFATPETNVLDQSLEFLNNYHTNIKLKYKINPEKLLDTKISNNNSSITTKVH